MNSYRSNGCTSKLKRTGAAMVAGTALALSAGTATAYAAADQLPGPESGPTAHQVGTEPGPPNYPQYDERYAVEPVEPVEPVAPVAASDSGGTSGQWLPIGAATIAVLGLASGGWWFYRRRGA
ncbi:hypothetical protein [Kribbella sp. NPDC048915]|uniref:hypothetical protein n=1 Tax=Kribbella sp. NPDC048915 TaxID=3155148 RepID=UPI0033DAB4E9